MYGIEETDKKKTKKTGSFHADKFNDSCNMKLNEMSMRFILTVRPRLVKIHIFLQIITMKMIIIVNKPAK